MKRITIYNDSNEIVAQFRIETGALFERSWVPARNSERVLHMLRNIPREVLRVDACYPKISSTFHRLNGYKMDIEAHIPEAKKPVEQPEKTIYFAPSPAELPNDGVLSYITVESAQDVINALDRCVVLLREEQLVYAQMIRDYGAAFSIAAKTITGLPAVSYSAAFEEAVYSFEKVAYAPFITELASEIEMAKDLEAQKRTAYDVEKAAFTRANGTVKKFTAFAEPDEDVADEPFSI